jgi:hypothetical protein
LKLTKTKIKREKRLCTTWKEIDDKQYFFINCKKKNKNKKL